MGQNISNNDILSIGIISETKHEERFRKIVEKYWPAVNNIHNILGIRIHLVSLDKVTKVNGLIVLFPLEGQKYNPKSQATYDSTARQLAVDYVIALKKKIPIVVFAIDCTRELIMMSRKDIAKQFKVKGEQVLNFEMRDNLNEFQIEDNERRFAAILKFHPNIMKKTYTI